MKNSTQAQAGQNLFMSSLTGLANVLAVAAAFFGGPTLWQYTVPYVENMTVQTYGADMVGFASLVWYGISFLIVYFTARATIGTALIFGGLAIVTRFM